ncbi:MAG TPA: deoxyribose-phosphate aldolase [Vicinamibacteria bacterium]|nr:deoxyribose-phosphate aldolase [Vicinamibacteria bacterium]
MRPLIERGAERFGLNASAPHADLAALIDHTLLKPDATEEQIRRLCAEAIEHGFVTVCIQPTWVRLAARILQGTNVGVCTVAGFPLGANTADVKAYETRRATFDGASEVDMVINIGALKSRDYRTVEEDIRGVTRSCREARAASKVIIEAALLTREEKIKACAIAAAAGADFVKTSTGFGPGGATVEDVALMREVVGPKLGVKAAGGVRDLKTAQRMVEAGASRIGASAGVRILRESRDEAT